MEVIERNLLPLESERIPFERLMSVFYPTLGNQETEAHECDGPAARHRIGRLARGVALESATTAPH